jgi:hypothetical protein
MNNGISSSDDCQEMNCELHSHADTCCFGKGAYILSIDQGSCAEVTGFSTQLGSVKSVPIVSAAVAYDCPVTFQTYILVFHQSLYIEDFNSHLICPNQMRLAGISVNDCPLQFLPPKQRTHDSHTIHTAQLRIPLQMKGVISYFQTRKPTRKELQNTDQYPHIEMTSLEAWIHIVIILVTMNRSYLVIITIHQVQQLELYQL